MSRLKTKRKASSYKSSNDWINAVYRQHKEFIDDKLKWVKDSKKQSFKQLLIERIENVYTSSDSPTTLSPKRVAQVLNKASKKEIKKALDKLARSDVFSSYEERQKISAYNAIHANKDAFKALRKATGWRNKINIENFEYIDDEKVYKYEGPKGTVYIDFTGSPKQTIYTLTPMKVDGKTQMQKSIIAEWDREQLY